MKRSFTYRLSIRINKPKELVWDVTQDYARRTEWDKGVIGVSIEQTKPHRVVRLRMKGRTTMTFVYKLDDRPNKTSLVATSITSPIIESAGGSWVYEEVDGGTVWSLTNTVGLKDTVFIKLLLPFIQWMFRNQTKTALRRAKRIIEASSSEP